MRIDLNADLGEGCPFDAELMPLITSANISCGAHAGDKATMSAALELAKQYGVCVGAHPGFADREHFGRREMELAPSPVTDQIRYLDALARAVGCVLEYVKPHGALYNLACRHLEYALPVAYAASDFGLAIMGLPDSSLQAAAAQWNLRFIREGFADRRYLPDGALVPRGQPNAFVGDPAEAVQQVDWLIRERGVQSICVHGDNPQAVAFVRRVREFLIEKGFALKPALAP